MSSIDCCPRAFVLLAVCVLTAACARGPGSEHEPRPGRVVPDWGLSTEPVQVRIEGERFLALPTQHLGGREPVSVDDRYEAFLGEVALEDVIREDVRTLRARVPVGLAPGWHTLVVVGPLGQRVALPRAYYASDIPLARLQAQATLDKAQVSVEERTRLVLTVENTGETDALAVTPVLRAAGEGRVDVFSAPGPAPIAAGASASFVWELGAAAPGDSLLTLELQGREATAGVELVVRGVEAEPLRIRDRAVLTTALTASRPVVDVGQWVTLSLRVTNTGGSAVRAVVPDSPLSRGVMAVRMSGPEPASADIPIGESRDFLWTYFVWPAGILTFEAGAVGRDEHSDVEVRAPTVRSADIIVQWPSSLEQLLADPFGDGSPFAQVLGYDGRLYLGPNRSGTGGVSVGLDGLGGRSFGFSFPRDTSGNSSQNSSSAPYPSIGATGCKVNTSACGPDNEDGRGFFFSGQVGTQQWLGIGGARSGGDLDYVYLTQDTSDYGSLQMRFLDLTSFLGGQTRGLSSALFFQDRLYLGFSDTGGNRPYLLVVKRLPTTAPGYESSLGLDAEELQAQNMPGIGQGGTPANKASPLMIDSLTAFNDRLYLANNGGCVRSTTPTPRSYGSAVGDWASCTPALPAWSSRVSRTTTKTADLEPADRAVPRLAVFQGRLYLARNTTVGPQLFVCEPARTASLTDCEPEDWSLVAPNSEGDTLLTQFNDPDNTSLSLLVATSYSLYVGFDNASRGTVLLRASGASPASRADFMGKGNCSAEQHPVGCEGLGGNGLGVGASRIFDGKVLGSSGAESVYLTVGDGAGPVRLFRLN